MALKIRSFLLPLLFVLFSGCGLTGKGDFPTLSPGELTVALYPGFAPVTYYDPETAEAVGIDVDVLREFAMSYELELKILVRAFDGIWELPARGQVDIAGTGISELDSRLVDGMRWSEPYYEVQRTLSIRAEDSGRLKTIADFEGLAIGYTPGSTGEYDTRERAPDSAELIPYEIEEQAIEDLLTGKIDAIARGDVSSLYDATVNSSLAVADLHYYDPLEYFVFAIPSGNVDLEQALNQFLIQMRTSGRIGDIVDSYLNQE